MIAKSVTILIFSLIFLIAITVFGQEIERNPKFVSIAKAELQSKLREAYFEVGKDETTIKEWLVLGPFPGDLGTDFLQSAGGEANIRPYEGMAVTTPDGKTYTWTRDQPNRVGVLGDTKELPILFRMEMTFQNELDDDNPYISADLRQAFKKNGISLSQNVRISIETQGSRWHVVDEEHQQRYIIVKEGEQLNVSLYPKNAIVYAAVTILSPKAQRLEMTFRVPRGTKVWLNGSLILNKPIDKLSANGTWEWDFLATDVKKGANHCLLRMGKQGGTIQLGFWFYVRDRETYLSLLELELTVRRQNTDSREALSISAQRELTSVIWRKSSVWRPPELPVSIEIRDEAAHLLTTLRAQEGEPVVWTVPETVSGTLRIIAKQTDAKGSTREARFTCRAHSTVPITQKEGHWETYDTTDGLAAPEVRAIVQDRDGAVWFGTTGGVTSYDGRTSNTFTTQDGLPSDSIWTIFSDSRGQLWFGTMDELTLKGAGVCKYDGETFRTFTTKDGLIDNAVMEIYEDKKGHLWFGTGGGVSEFDGETFRNYTFGGSVETIAQDKAGNFWFGHGIKGWTGMAGGVTRYDGKSFRRLDLFKGRHEWLDSVYRITTDAAGNLWFGTAGGVSFYDGKAVRHFTTADGLADDMVHDVFQSDSGSRKTGFRYAEDLWFATTGGISRYRDGKFQNFTTRHGLADNYTECVATDREGNLWFGTGNGASRYDPSVVSIAVESDVGELEGRIIRDRQGNLWFGVKGVGLGRYDGRRLRTFSIEDGLPGDRVRKLYEDSRGNIWVYLYKGSLPGGLAKYDGKTFHREFYRNVMVIFEDSQGTLWVAGTGGVFTYDGEKFVRAATRQEVGGFVTDILQDKNGTMWFATLPSSLVFGKLDGGVCRYDGETFTRFTTADGLPDKACWQLLEDQKGNIWVGTSGGLGRYDGEKFTAFTTENGLPHKEIRKLFEDSKGNLWILTPGGLCRYDGETFQTFTMADGLASNQMDIAFEDSRGNLWFGGSAGGVHQFDGENFQRFTTDDGLLSNRILEILEDEDGKMIFATEKGFTIYTPPEERIPLPVTVTEVVADKVYSIPEDAFTSVNHVETEFLGETRSLKIPSTAKHISFAYYGRSFKTKRIRYNYMLEDYDTDWQATWNEQVSYENLKPGEYVFKVIAINRDLVYSETPATVHLKIVPPFYLRAGFLIPTLSFGAILLATLTILSIGYVKRRRQVQAYQQEAVLELQDAREMQMALLPETAPSIEKLEFAGECIPANTVGGDFYDYVPLGDDIPAIVLADVSGKGMKAAMYAVLSSGVLHAEAKESVSPSQMLQILNEDLKARVKELMNCAMCIATIDLNQRLLRYSNAGIPYPIVKRKGEVFELECNGMPLGGFLKFEYEDVELELQSGDVVVFFSDGVTECLSKENPEQFYEETGRLFSVIGGFDEDMNAQAMIQAILADLRDFASNNAQSDDITIVVVKVKDDFHPVT